MNRRSLREDLQEHYRARELDPATLRRLQALTEAVPTIRSTIGRQWSVLTAAAVLLIAAVSLFVGSRTSESPEVQSLNAGVISRAIADEIAMNHNKQLDLDLITPSLDEVRDQMTRLDFALIDSPSMAEGGLQLIGARYCSIQGQLAAQLRFQSLSGDFVTLYQSPAVESMDRPLAAAHSTEGVAVRIWEEQGVLFGLAQSEKADHGAHLE